MYCNKVDFLDNCSTDACQNYSFHFQPITNNRQYGSVRFINHSKNEDRTIGLVIHDQEFQNRFTKNIPSIIADLIDLAVAIYTSDRLAPHNLENQFQRQIHVALPVRNPDLLSQTLFNVKLQQRLTWVSGSYWSFEFQKRKISGRYTESQPNLFPTIEQGSEVALWSGGLDSLAGLYTRLKNTSNQSFVLFGTGSNKVIHARQKEVADRVQTLFSDRVKLLRCLIELFDSKDNSKNKLCRVRGVFFSLLGSACSYLMGQRKLYIYENGIGAINLPYRKSCVGLDLSRSVHPQTLMMVSDVVSELLGEPFQVVNPFLFWTKAEMCRDLCHDSRNNWIVSTFSCDRPHRKKEVTQCGYCSSCLLRRQAILAAHMEDETPYVLTHGEGKFKGKNLYFNSMQVQVQTLKNALYISPEMDIQWHAITKQFPELDEMVDLTAESEKLSVLEMRSRLIRLYKTYVSEWETVEPRLSMGILDPPLNDNQTISNASLTLTSKA